MELSKDRVCGKCTACCLTHAVFELKKVPGVLCPFCELGQGCRIYATRPSGCQTFECDWLKGFGGEELRPDRCGVIFDSAESPEFGKVLQLWEAKKGQLDLSNPKIKSWIMLCLENKYFVSCLFLDGRKFLFTYLGAKLGKQIRKSCHQQRIKIVSINDLLDCKKRPLT